MEEIKHEDDDFCHSILSQFSTSNQEAHEHLCAIVISISKTFKDENIPATTFNYFGATCANLNKLYLSEPHMSLHSIEAHITIVSLLLPRMSSGIIREHRKGTLEIVLQALQSNSVTTGVAVAGIKCVAQWLIVGDCENWGEVSQLYRVLLDFATHMKIEVRRQSHLCISDVLQSLQGKPLLGSASEEIANTFHKFFLIAGGSNTESDDRHHGAREVLHLLEALKEWLPLLTVKSTTSILKHFKLLLELELPIVTMHITACLNKISLSPTFSAEARVDELLGVGNRLSQYTNH